ncbi:MAG: phosphoribosyltransferase family protein [Catalinimonas sp.]
MLTTDQHRLLDAAQIKAKVQRLAFQIYEYNYAEPALTLIGVAGNGVLLARMLADELRRISPFDPSVGTVKLNKTAPLDAPIVFDVSPDVIARHSVVIVDDVLNTGRTLAYALRPFLDLPLHRLQVVVLVDRDHKSFPIAADFVGHTLATTLQEHVEVRLDDEEHGVYLR